MNPKVHGAGLGLRRDLLDKLETTAPDEVDFFEIAPENWMQAGGRYQKRLRSFTERFPFTCHGLSLSIGSTDPLDEPFVRKIKGFMDEHNIALYTEHLSWCSYKGHLYDLLPIPFTLEAAQWVAERVMRVQDILQRRIALENASYYLRPPNSEMDEADFICEVVERSDCNLHLDINNVYVNSRNFGFDPISHLHALPLNKVAYVHVAGHHVQSDGFIIDTHGADVIDPVWNLLSEAYAMLDDRESMPPTCLERDFNFPDMDVLLSEVARIRSLQEQQQDAMCHNRL